MEIETFWHAAWRWVLGKISPETVDQWFHVNSADNPADTATHGISAECLEESSLVRVASFLLGNEWPLKPNLNVINDIFSKNLWLTP